ncbi:L-methionine/branched-chain amino acid transporter [Vibrio sp. ZSDZ34]|uniref:L-methionine/branched-chain amino acid transporter n=1 Tax=Vibrio gelatinilyticus TaxID=2893468 RepID=A0A9X1W9L2_9VIBR|nr:L-methionine/branched-chain amino acid transporter [Vibrio gelatinilyticus]MCJ2376822.1 L-methionine/branched-chain amino acid transporter [Vibrio gelatinilyticus]
MNRLKKEITLSYGIAQMSTTLLGTGLFMVPAIAAGIAGQSLPWAWLILLVAVSPIALTFATLGKHFPSAGGTSYFVKKAFGRRLEKAVAWLFLSVIPVGVPAAIALAGGFAQQILPAPLSGSIASQLFVVVMLMAVNLIGSKSSGRLQSAIAVGIVVLVICCWYEANIALSDMSLPPLTQESAIPISSALAVMFWCFVGIEAFAHMGEEFKNPQRDFPIAIIVGCIIAGMVYWAFSIVVLKLGAYGTPAMDKSSVPYITTALFGSSVNWLISLMGLLACFASINLYTQGLSRMLWAQAQQYYPNGKLATLSARGVPAYATLLIGVVLVISSVIGELSGIDLEEFLKLANGVFVLVYLLAMWAGCHLLDGLSKGLAIVSLMLCVIVLLFLKWSMLYAIIIFLLFLLPKGSRSTSANCETNKGV